MDFIGDGHTLDISIGDMQHCILVDNQHMPTLTPLSLKQQGVHLMWVVAISETEFTSCHEADKKENVLQDICETF